MTTELLGTTFDSPIVIAPTGSNRAFHSDGEVAVANAARTGNHLQILSSGATTSIEDVIAARGAPVWFQLYPRKWEITQALLKRAEWAGSLVAVVTVDGGASTNWERLLAYAAPIRGSATPATAAVFGTTSPDGRISTALTSAIPRA